MLAGCLIQVSSYAQRELSAAQIGLPRDTQTVSVLIKLANNGLGKNKNEVMEHANNAITIAKAVKDPYWLARAYLCLSSTGTFYGDFKMAEAALLSADSVRQRNPLPALEPFFNYFNGYLEEKKHHRPKAIQYYLAALTGFEQVGDSTQVANVAKSLGLAYFYDNDFGLAGQYLERAKAIYENMGDQKMYTVVLGMQSSLLGAQGKYDESNALLWEAGAIYKQIKNYSGAAVSFNNIGMNWLDQERYDSSLYYFKEALKYDELSGDPVGLSYSKINIASVLRKLKKYREALTFMKEAVTTADTLGALLLQKTANEDMAILYEEMGEPGLALPYYKKFVAVKDSIFSQDNTRIKAELQSGYENKQKEAALQNLKLKQRQQNTILIAVGIFVVLLIWIIVQRSRLQKQKIQLAQEQLSIKELELGAVAERVLQKDELIDEITQQIETFKTQAQNEKHKNLEELLHARLSTDDDWLHFQTRFQAIYPDFFKKLLASFPTLSATEVKICAIEKLGINDKQAGAMLGVNTDSIRKARYRLRKNLGEQQYEELQRFMLQH
ncbi:MAG: tetratricopeptide repeat protein [Chitinophagaceae bacterium]|nr:tetratricopeptide repeat protein [Chitinophagaceae bacterium]